MSPLSWAARRWAAIVACLLMTGLLVGCSAAAEDTVTRNKAICERAFSENVAGANGTDLDITIRRCVQWSDWIVAAQAYPDALGGLSPLEVLEARCSDPVAGLASYATCGSLEQSTATLRPTPRVTVPPIRTPEPTPRPRRERRVSATQRPAAAENRSRSNGSPRNCTPGYEPCLPRRSDWDCFGGGGDGPAYTKRGQTYKVPRSDPYGLDSDNDGLGCEPRGR
jgi:hypothetical protein